MRRHHFDRFQGRHLHLDADHKKLGGVCSGLARYFEVQPLFVRGGALIALCLAPQATLIAYGLAYFVLDEGRDSEP